MATFPTILGKCLISSFSYSDHDTNVSSTIMDSGRQRRRQRASYIPSDFNVQFSFDETQLGIFEFFNQEAINSSEDEFDIYLRTGKGLVLHTAKYKQAPVVSRQGFRYNVSCQLEVQERPDS